MSTNPYNAPMYHQMLHNVGAHSVPPNYMDGFTDMPARTQVDDLDIDAVRCALEGKILELRTAGLMKEAHAAAQVLSELG